MPDYIGGQNAGCGGYLMPGTLDGTTSSKDRNSLWSLELAESQLGWAMLAPKEKPFLLPDRSTTVFF